MPAGSQRLENSFTFSLLRTSAETSSAFIDMFSASKPREAIKGATSLAESGAYNQEAFRYFLAKESKRSERSGRFCQIILVCSTDEHGRIVEMNVDVAKTVIAAASRSFRETDYIGWYREGRIVGAVLTVLTQESMALVPTQLQPRLAECLRADLGIEEFSRLQIRVCQPHEVSLAEGVTGYGGNGIT
jgi:hypothetical protein